MGFFDSKPLYGGKYSVKAVNAFSEEDKKAVSSVVVVPSEFGLSACFTLTNGYKAYTPMSTDSSVQAGEELDINNLEVVVLSRIGSNDLERIRVKQ